MSEFIIAIKKVILLLLLAIVTYFLTFFILVNDHLVTLYMNPAFTSGNSEIQLPVWIVVLASLFIGIILTSIISWLYVSKFEKNIEEMVKENQVLKKKLERVKQDVSKCVK